MRVQLTDIGGKKNMTIKCARKTGPGTRLTIANDRAIASGVGLLAVLVLTALPSTSTSVGPLLSTDTLALKTCIERAYPDSIAQVVLKEARIDHLEMTNGTTFVWDDGRAKTFEEKLSEPDFEDTLSIPYPTHASPPPAKNVDPGRIRLEPFLRAAYGADQNAVKKNLIPVRWEPTYRRVSFNKKNGAADALASVARSLARLAPRFRPYLTSIGGTFKWRTIKDTHRLSAHAFGIAIDINVKRSRYWKWTPRFETAVFPNATPSAIVDIFEKHHFVWGGKWYHFDTMHFEYRPELFCQVDPRPRRSM